ncbi:hypothetical protein B7463_g7924, partial [Scytalidium lignicola]
MPLWTVFHPLDAFTFDQKAALTADITKIYTDFGLPKFYVGVVYIPIPKESFFIGAKPVDNFIRVKVDHIARTLPTPEIRKWWVETTDAQLKSHIADRGFDFEWHIDETPFDLWSIQGIPPPPGGSEAEKLWIEGNKPVKY